MAMAAMSTIRNWMPKLRIGSGLVLFAYILCHFTGHASGLYSLEVQNSLGEAISKFWRPPPMTVLLYGSLAVHVLAALSHWISRRSWSMTLREAIQLATGIAIPLFMALHVIGTRWGVANYGMRDSYAYVLYATTVASPIDGWLNATGLIIVWLHCCIGIHFWLRFKPGYTPRIRLAGFAMAIIMPLLALGGYLASARMIAPLATSGEWLEAYYERLNIPSNDVWGWLAQDAATVRYVFVGIVVLALLLRIGLWVAQQLNSPITISYVNGPTVRTAKGATLLDVSKSFNVAHANVCGGRGRCSTCRVMVTNSPQAIEIPEGPERVVLERLRAPVGVRLACQLRCASSMQVTRLLPADVTMRETAARGSHATGQERIVNVLFADLRDFTKTSESRLPFDVVYLINQFSQEMGEAIHHNGGRVDKFLGDGVMALFGIDTDMEKGARNALDAAAEMHRRLAELNERLAEYLDKPLRMGVGIHTGPVILGDMGYGNSRGLTAIGDTVNTASRLEAETKATGTRMCISEATLKAAHMSANTEVLRVIEIRGKSIKLNVAAIDTLDELQKTLETASA